MSLSLESWKTAAALALALGALLTAPAAAQRGQGTTVFSGPIEAGLRSGRDFENHAWSLGAQIRLPVSRNLELRPSGDFFFPKNRDRGRQFNADAAVRLGQALYGGYGLAFLDLDESGGKQQGHNWFVGLNDTPGKRLTSFAELRWTFYNDTSPFRLALGFNYALTGGRR